MPNLTHFVRAHDTHLWDDAKAVAAQHHISLSQLLTDALRWYLARLRT